MNLIDAYERNAVGTLYDLLKETVFVIAEAASTHDGSLDRAIELIGIAARAGADACKFQFWSDADLLADRRKVEPEYRDIYRRYQVPVGWLPILRDECAEAGIEFMCTTFLPQDIAVVEPFVQRFKIASFEAGDHGFLKAHNQFDKPVILSTGMMELGETARSVEVLERCNGLLHCVSAYPCHNPDLTVITKLRQWQSVPVGFSDHTACELTGALAVMAGAQIVEVHFTSPNTSRDNPDDEVAVPNLSAYISNIIYAEQCIGNGQKSATEQEFAMTKYRVIS